MGNRTGMRRSVGAGGRFGWTLVALCVVAAGCVAGEEAHTPASVKTTVTDGDYSLSFELPRATWATTDAIDGTATLAYDGLGTVTIWGSGSGPLNFGYAEVGGSKKIEPAWTADCTNRQFSAGEPIVSALKKSGGWSGEDPDASFYESFFSEAAVHLPAGDWTITAVAEFTEGQCGGAHHAMQATVSIHIEA